MQPGAILSAKKEERIRAGYSRCDMHIDLFNRGKLALQPGCDLVQTLEAEVMGELNKIREVAGKVTFCVFHKKHIFENSLFFVAWHLLSTIYWLQTCGSMQA